MIKQQLGKLTRINDDRPDSRFQVTADAMLTINPSKPGSNNEGVFSLRA